MNCMRESLAAKKARGERVLVAYYPLCDPALGDAVEAAGVYLQAGADVLEMGVPCEDPRLDGATVRASMERALAHHAAEDAFDAIARIRAAYPTANLQVMCYSSFITGMGADAFARRAAESGANAVLSPDFPEEERAALDEVLAAHDLLSLRFVPYHLDADGIDALRRYDEGYLFMQAVDGATGVQSKVDPHVGENIAALKAAGFTANLCAGFGVSSASDAQELVALGADGVIVGSAIISSALEGRMAAFIASLRAALDGCGTA